VTEKGEIRRSDGARPFEVATEPLAQLATVLANQGAKQREAILTRVPAGKLGAPADVAAAAVYLASDEAHYVTGQTLHVNGGMAMI